MSRRLPRRSTFLIAACDELTDLSLIGSTAAHENFILVPQRARELPRRAADAEGPPHTAVASEEVTDSDHSVCSLPDVSVGWIVRESTIRFRPTIVPYLGYRWIIQSETSRRLDFCPWRPASRPLDECCRLSRKTHVGKGGERGAELRPATSLVQLGHALSSRFGRQIAEGGLAGARADKYTTLVRILREDRTLLAQPPRFNQMTRTWLASSAARD